MSSTKVNVSQIDLPGVSGELLAGDGTAVTVGSGLSLLAGTLTATGGGGGGTLYSGSGNPNTVPTFVQGISSAGLTATLPGTVTAGNLLVVQLQAEADPSASTCTDNLGTVYSIVTTVSVAGTNVKSRVFAGIAPSSGIVTITGTQPATFPRTSVGEYKNATATVDAVNGALGANSLNLTITTTSSLVVGMVGNYYPSPTFVAGAGMTADFTGTGSDSTFFAHGVANAPGLFVASYTCNTSYAESTFIAVAFRPAPAGPTPGVDGDFYIDTTNRVLYGPRTAGAYPRIGALLP